MKEVARYANFRKFISNGVHYLDFSNVSSQKDIEEVYKKAGIDYLLQFTVNDKSPKMSHEKSANDPKLAKRGS